MIPCFVLKLAFFAGKHPDPFDDVCRVSYITECNNIYIYIIYVYLIYLCTNIEWIIETVLQRMEEKKVPSGIFKQEQH